MLDRVRGFLRRPVGEQPGKTGNPSLSRKQVGTRGEKLALQHLKKRGYRVLRTNFRCRQGEIDIIAEKAGMLIFVEVRTKTGSGFISPEESVTRGKVERLVSLAGIYLQTLDGPTPPWRIDVVAVELGPGSKVLRLEHIENATG
ncbi:MAG: YraN family protein [Dehalococcoidia bacterium]|nr:YraN family protein [Dehalococcoidia bacterium]